MGEGPRFGRRASSRRRRHGALGQLRSRTEMGSHFPENGTHSTTRMESGCSWLRECEDHACASDFQSIRGQS